MITQFEEETDSGKAAKEKDKKHPVDRADCESHYPVTISDRVLTNKPIALEESRGISAGPTPAAGLHAAFTPPAYTHHPTLFGRQLPTCIRFNLTSNGRG